MKALQRKKYYVSVPALKNVFQKMKYNVTIFLYLVAQIKVLAMNIFPFMSKEVFTLKFREKIQLYLLNTKSRIRNSLSQFVDQLPRDPFVWRRNQVSVTTFLTAFQDLGWIMVRPELNVDGG